MGIAFFFALVLIGVLVVMPIWTLIAIANLKRGQRELAQRLAALEAGAASRSSPTPAPAAHASAVEAIEVTAGPAAPVPAPTQPPPLSPPVPAAPSAPITLPPVADTHPQVPPSTPPATAVPSPETPAPRPAPPPPPPPPPTPRPKVNWEVFMGVKLFAWLGGLALFLGVGFFVKYSFEHDLIPPEVRVALGFLTGTALVVGGVLLSRKRYTVTSHTLCATGVVSLYAVTFACRAVYRFEFFGALPTFALMALITTAAFLLAIRMEAKVVAVLGMLGGFLTPVLLSTGSDNPVGLFSYLALLDLGLIAVALHRRWHFLVPLGALGTVLMQVGWAAKYFSPERETVAELVVLGFSLLFVLAFVAGRRLRQTSATLLATAAAVPFMAFGFAWLFLGYTDIAREPAAFFVFLLLADALILAVAWLDPRAARFHALAGAAAFLVLAVWTQRHLGLDQLYAGLAAYLGFAVLQTAAPLLLARRHEGAIAPAGWQQLWPAFMLGLVLLGVGKLPDVPVALWVAVLLLDLLAIGVAVACASLVGVIVVLLLTLASAGHWLLRMPSPGAEVLGFLGVVGGFAVLFVGAGLWLLRRAGGVTSATPSGNSGALLAAGWQAHLPTLAVLLPFVLLMMVVSRVSLADPSAVFGLGLLLSILALGLTGLLRFGWLPLATLVGVTGLLWAWHERTFRNDAAGLALAWYAGFHALFAVFPFLDRRRLIPFAGPWIAAALSGVAVFPLFLDAIKQTWPNDQMGLLPAVFALPAFASLAAVIRLLPDDHPRRLSTMAWFGGVALFFVTLIFPIQFDRQWITIGWALEGAALLWWFQRVPHAGLRLTGVGLLVVAFARLISHPPLVHPWVRGEVPLLNTLLYTYTAVVLCLFIGARLLAPPRDRFGRISLPAVLQAMGVGLLFLLMNLQVADFYAEPGSRVAVEFSGNFARDMTYTIAWSLFAFALLVVGLWRRIRPARWAALALLSAALLKLFFHDLSQLGQLHRIGAFVAVALVAILASFVYQRFLPSPSPSATSPDATPPPPPSA